MEKYYTVPLVFLTLRNFLHVCNSVFVYRNYIPLVIFYSTVLAREYKVPAKPISIKYIVSAVAVKHV